MRRIVFGLAMALLVPAAGCHPRANTTVEEDDTDLATISIVSHHRLNVVIYNVAQGHRDRLGEVTAAGNATFRLHLRRTVASEVQLLADPIGSPTTTRTDLVHLQPGDVLEWTLEDDLARSHYEIH